MVLGSAELVVALRGFDREQAELIGAATILRELDTVVIPSSVVTSARVPRTRGPPPSSCTSQPDTVPDTTKTASSFTRRPCHMLTPSSTER